MHSSTKTHAIKTAEAFMSSLNSVGAGLPELIHPKGLIQHNPALGDGLYGLALALQDREHQPYYFEVLLAFEAEPFVVLICTREAQDVHLGVELLRFEDGRIREHWDNYCVTSPSIIRSLQMHLKLLQKVHEPSIHRSPLSRARQITTAFLTEGVIKRQADALWHLAPGGYKEWHAEAGLLTNSVREHARNAQSAWIFNVVRLHAVISDGHFAVGVSEGRSGSCTTCHFDFFVLGESGIVFRLPIDEIVPLPVLHRNPNGKFGLPA
jgi:hypothetical protein